MSVPTPTPLPTPLPTSANLPADPPPPEATAQAERICVICNAGSGRNSREDDPVAAAMAVLGDRADLWRIKKGSSIEDAARKAVAAGYGTVVAAGGDGTIMTVAAVVAGSASRLGVLPMGTFNYFARGLRLPLDLAEAAGVVASGTARSLSLGEVNGHIFLNNASLGVYPAILKAREDIYRRWGRHRIVAYWSVVKTFARFQRPMHMTITIGGESRSLRSPLVFVARSTYQLESFGLSGGDRIREGEFAVFVSPDNGRIGLFMQAWRLVLRRMQEGRDFDLHCAETVSITTRRPRQLIACDGEKLVLDSPLEFRMHHHAVQVVVPAPDQAGAAPE